MAELLGALVLLVAVPYALRGPQLLLDDWFFLRNAHFGGLLATGSHRQLMARPGAWLIYTLQFGVVGRHPLALYAIQTLANAAVAALLYLVLRRFFAARLAATASALWVLFQNHASLSRWFSTLPAVVALGLLLAATMAADADAARRERISPLAVSLLIAGSLCYEAVLPMAFAVVVVVPIVHRRRDLVRFALPAIAALVPVALWMLTHRLYAAEPRADFRVLLFIHFGSGIAPWFVGTPLAVCALIGILVAGRAVLVLGRREPPEVLVFAGLAVIVVGSAAFVRWPWAIAGLNDRANVVGAIGGAMVWTGLLALLGRRSTAAATIALVALVAIATPMVVSRDTDYVRAGRDTRRTLAVMESPDARAGSVVIGDPPRHHGVYGLLAWMAPAAAQLDSGDAHIPVHYGGI